MCRDPQDTVRIFLCVVSLSLTIAGSISASIRLPRSSFKVILSGSSDCPAVIIDEHFHASTATHNEHANSSCVVRHRARQVFPEMPYEINSIYPMTWNALREKYLQSMSENWFVRPPSFLRYLCLMGFRAMYFSIDRKVSIISWRLPWRVLRHWYQVRPLSFDHPKHACADFAYVINLRGTLVYLVKDISYLLIADVFITRRFPSVGILRIGHVSFDSKLLMYASLVSVPWHQYVKSCTPSCPHFVISYWRYSRRPHVRLIRIQRLNNPPELSRSREKCDPSWWSKRTKLVLDIQCVCHFQLQNSKQWSTRSRRLHQSVRRSVIQLKRNRFVTHLIGVIALVLSLLIVSRSPGYEKFGTRDLWFFKNRPRCRRTWTLNILRTSY